MSQDNKAIAEKLNEIGEAFMALSTLFLVGGDKADTPARTAKAAAKSSAKSKPVSEPTDEPTEDDVRTALKALMDKHGKDKMIEALGTVGAAKLVDVDESQYTELLETVQGLMDAETEAPEVKKPAAKKTAKAKKGPTIDDVTTKLKELIEADRAVAKSVLKNLGVAKASELDEDQYADALEAIEAALAEDGDDNLIG
jgi:ATP phosphoribosyltransferase